MKQRNQKSPKVFGLTTIRKELPSTEIGLTRRSWFREIDLEFSFEHVRFEMLPN